MRLFCTDGAFSISAKAPEWRDHAGALVVRDDPERTPVAEGWRAAVLLAIATAIVGASGCPVPPKVGELMAQAITRHLQDEGIVPCQHDDDTDDIPAPAGMPARPPVDGDWPAPAVIYGGVWELGIAVDSAFGPAVAGLFGAAGIRPVRHEVPAAAA